MEQHRASSAVFALQGGSLAPLEFVMPATSPSKEHAVYYSDRFTSNGAADIDSGCITFGQRDGQPWLHCHAAWTESNGHRRCGHILPAESQISEPLRVTGWLLDGAGFVVTPDPETNFSLFQPVPAASQPAGAAAALVVCIRPNTDLCTALENICHVHGITHGKIRGGAGSLVSATFSDGRTVEPFVTEVFIRQGVITPGDDGFPRAEIDISLVDYTGQMAEGRLRRGHNPVLVTFEVMIEATGGPVHVHQP